MTEAFSFNESFTEPINQSEDFHASWIPRIAGIDVDCDRETALARLQPAHDQFVARYFPDHQLHHAEQIHGCEIAVIDQQSPPISIGADGLMTNFPGQLLGIYVADCAAIYLADPVSCSIALLHSGRKGTEGNILSHAVSLMKEHYGTLPENLICLVSPCIRPPHYEVDIAEMIAKQASELGIGSFHDCGENTAEDLDRHYSYRIEKGKTGRMLALLSLKKDNLRNAVSG